MAILQKGSWGRQNQQTTHVKQKKAAARFQNELHMGPISLTKPHYLLMQTSKMSTFFTLMNVHLPLKVLSSLHNRPKHSILIFYFLMFYFLMKRVWFSTLFRFFSCFRKKPSQFLLKVIFALLLRFPLSFPHMSEWLWSDIVVWKLWRGRVAWNLLLWNGDSRWGENIQFPFAVIANNFLPPFLIYTLSPNYLNIVLRLMKRTIFQLKVYSI